MSDETWPRITRIETGADGRSRFEDLVVPMIGIDGGAQSDEIACESFSFRRKQNAYLAPLHPAPRRQLILTLEGQLEIECEDGTVRRFGPGEMLLADDVTGGGHVARQLADRKSVVLRLGADHDFSAWRC